MAQCISNLTWFCYLLVLYAGPLGSSVSGSKVRAANRNPSTLETQAKFFQDFFSVQLSPYKVEFGHVCEDPNNWEQRYERKDYKNHRDMGKVRWGDKKGGYGEHYWDLNHAGHTGDHNDHDEDDYEKDFDDGSYNEEKYTDPYEEPSESHPKYVEEEYDPKSESYYDPSDRSKRAGKTRVEKITEAKEGDIGDGAETVDINKTQKQIKHKHGLKEEKKQHHEQIKPNVKFIAPESARDKVILKDNNETNKAIEQGIVKTEPPKYQQPSAPWRPHRFGGGGFNPSAPWGGPHLHFGQRTPVKQLQPPPVQQPRLYFDAATGRVYDRATGQTFLLQPLVVQN